MEGSLERDDIRALAVCPEPYCAVPRGVPCDHDGDPYPPARRAELNAAGTSHYARMLAAYGKSAAVALQIARRAAGHPPVRGSMDQLAVGMARCPRHDCPEGVPCPRGGACPARRGLAAVVAARGRAVVSAVVAFIKGADHATMTENRRAGTGPDPCDLCFLASSGVLVPAHDCATGGPA